ncbi:type II toxin-antitoxin system HipA family toxin [Dyella humicola]|uniref:type II toxin-antitoxin system HipA family toxin n=1 Tax=Dyella humicola TaxID=2992126 RepID=UPI0022592138|nr:HipA domain-containing protein [Dyella humicola]
MSSSQRARQVGELAPKDAFVWIWLPGRLEPVVAGQLAVEGLVCQFTYSSSYLERGDAIPIFAPELPLQRGVLTPLPPLDVAGCLRDGSPDAWGRRTIVRQLTGLVGEAARDIELDELTVMLHSSSGRIGALDFQRSGARYEPRALKPVALDALLEAAECLEEGEPMSPSLTEALNQGSGVGGARPKALVEDARGHFIAKFPAPGDVQAVVKAEYVAMRLAKEAAHLTVAPVQLQQARGKDVLLVQRFDRERHDRGWTRRAMVSALTLFGLSEMEARYASYCELATIIQAHFTEPEATLHELFGRMVFNVLVGNTDDHARNHAAFWGGAHLSLTPAYDICPQSRLGREANQAMFINGDDRRSRLESCRRAAPQFLLADVDARALIAAQVIGVRRHWHGICDEAGLSQGQREVFWKRQFLNDYVFEGYPDRF